MVAEKNAPASERDFRKPWTTKEEGRFSSNYAQPSFTDEVPRNCYFMRGLQAQTKMLWKWFMG
jgi:hypothetical protein